MPVLQFFAGAKDPASFPPESLPEVAFVGRSNVGKSSLINVLTNSTIVRVSNKPGLTRQINFFTASDDFHVVDMPGYGFAYAKEEMRESWKSLIETYIEKRRTLKRLYIMVDARHGVKYIDKQFMEMVDSKNVKFQVVMTKCDLVPRPVLARRYCVVLKDLAEYRHSIKSILMASAHTKAGINNMRKSILHVIGAPIKLLPPSGKSKEPSKKKESKRK
ncbi:ribosome biogenesis GTP-binding protein YsxC [Basidiobolus meristosporus CBS 931.73]|uniref:Ribosome biogenesis GTP-binding protein YsxC n=1 Tax=Basidiobolus meristosporus CBS 931.73 TaxID=1314790 RepID=A0A1Y1XZ38_9FUNG|nr:ribosome biogenesis GTP-binding protein YsxC [Basidiobolus meristosporus CBS 931.73]|eukprot:ORX90634.1 ribosome biogenesis GTP-binding protein YsxC [Basidiobolus meristosporus CBS 931.73]